jgi:hypothetical protein
MQQPAARTLVRFGGDWPRLVRWEFIVVPPRAELGSDAAPGTLPERDPGTRQVINDWCRWRHRQGRT